MNLPVIDLSGASFASPHETYRIARDVGSACETAGFFYVVNHGVPESLQYGVLRQTERLFGLPEASKQSVHIQKSQYMRGYFGYGADKSDGVHDDIKEGFDLGLDLPTTDPYVAAGLPFYGPNTWPTALPDFKAVMNAYYDAMSGLGMTLLRAFAISLDVEPGFFAERFEKPMAQMRLLRYPPHRGRRDQVLGAGEQTDFGYVTMILQDHLGGLEIKTSEDEWLPVPPLPGSFVVNIGDLMQRWTNDRYIATMHRVVNNKDKARFSIAFFMDPDFYARVECLPTCIATNKPARYQPISAGEYMNRRFVDTTTFHEKILLTF